MQKKRLMIWCSVWITGSVLLSGCALDGPALEQEFKDSDMICFSVKGNVIHRFDPMLWQSVFSPSGCEFTVCEDNMSDFYTLRCSSVPREEGAVVTCDVSWTTYTDIKKKKGLEFRVVKADPASGAVWLWNPSSMIGAAVMITE